MLILCNPLGVAPGGRVVLAALPARKIAVVRSMAIAAARVNGFIADLPGVFNA